ncbi:MAG: hypothetical protein V1875_07705 [Candidatus Altiarchaeota archaeon]
MPSGKVSWVVFFLLSVAVLSGCLWGGPQADDPEEMVCNPPYMRYAAGCCLDREGNGICDADELTATTKTTVRQTTTSTTQAPRPVQTTVTTTSTTLPDPPTTTAAAIACTTHADCGAERNYTRCHQGSVVLYFEKPRCEHPGRPDSQCIIKSSIQAYQKCESWEACIGARCVNASDMSCDDACEDKDMASWYCDGGISCRGKGVRAQLGDIWCQPRYCCCNSTVQAAASTTTLRPTTTITLGGCSDNGCKARCIAEFPKGNHPLEYAVDGICETQGGRFMDCPQWSGYDGRLACHHQGCVGCCIGQQWGWQCDCICLGPLYADATSTTLHQGSTTSTQRTTTSTQRTTTTTTIRHCIDSDGGRDYFTAGICSGYNQVHTWYNVNDYCIDSRNLYECYCGDADLIYAAGSTCPSGCSQGRCNPTTTTTTLRRCIDSDGGISYYAAGSCQGYNSDYTRWNTDSDYCSGSIIYECYCGADNRLNHSLIICPDGCANNRCNPVG